MVWVFVEYLEHGATDVIYTTLLPYRSVDLIAFDATLQLSSRSTSGTFHVGKPFRIVGKKRKKNVMRTENSALSLRGSHGFSTVSPTQLTRLTPWRIRSIDVISNRIRSAFSFSSGVLLCYRVYKTP